MIPSNTLQIQKLLKQAYNREDLSQIIIQKVGKAAILAMAEATIQERTNKGLLDLNSCKLKRGDR